MTVTKTILSRVGLLAPARMAREMVRRILRPVGETVRRTLHPVREAVVRMPDPLFLMTSPPPRPPYDEHLAQLKKDGITRLSAQIAPHTLAMLKADFERNFIERLNASGKMAAGYTGDVTVADEYIDTDAGLYASNEPFAISRALLEICLKPELVGLINSYLGKAAYITQGVALRLEANPKTGFGSFQWHHDAWGKRINMMIILTEVGEADQYMTYAKGSHRLRHSYDKYLNSRCTSDELTRYCGNPEVVRCMAHPGDIYIFDSNGLHSGNRTNGLARDTFILEYTRLAHAVWAHHVPRELLTEFSEEQLRPLKWILEQDRSQRPLAPPINSWVDGLPRVDKWLF